MAGVASDPRRARAATFHLIPGETAGQTPKAIIVPKPGRTITEEEILEYAAQHLASYKKPRKIVIVDSVPRSETGKIDRKAIRKMYEEV